MTALEILLERLNEFVNEPVSHDSKIDYGRGVDFGKELARQRIRSILDNYESCVRFDEHYASVKNELNNFLKSL